MISIPEHVGGDSLDAVIMSDRPEILSGVSERLSRGQSVVLTGASGLGRTRVLDGLSAAFRPGRCWRIHGRDAVTGVPLVPFAGMLADLGVDNTLPLSIYTSLPRTAAASGSVAIVDDADMLDAASAVLLVQLCRAGVVAVMSSRSLGLLARPLQDHLTAATWWHEQLEPLSDAEILLIAERISGSALSAPAAPRLLARARGNPGLAGELIRTGIAAGTMMPAPGGLRINGFVVSIEARRIAGIALDELSEQGRDALELVVVGGAIPAGTLAPRPADELLSSGLVRLADSETVEVVDPLVTDVVLDGIDDRRQRGLALRAADLLGAVPGNSRLAALLSSLGGLPATPADVVHAGQWLLDLGRPDRAFRFLSDDRHELLAPSTLCALLLVRSTSAMQQGLLAEALADLDRAAELSRVPDDLVGIADRWTLLLGGRAQDDRALEDRIDAVIARLADPEHRSKVAAGLARRRAILGHRGSDVSRPHEDAAADDAILNSLRASLDGSRDVTPGSGDESDPGLAPDDDLDGLLEVLAEYLDLVYDGNLSRARHIAEAHYARDVREALPSLGLWTYNRSKMAFHAGQYDAASTLAQEAVRHLAWRDITGQAVPADAMLAAALARLGHQSRAEDLISQIEPVDLALPRVAIGAARVRAERMRGQGDAEGAAAELDRAGILAIEAGEVFSGALAIDEAFMINPETNRIDLLTGLDLSSRLIGAYIARAEAMIERNPGALEVAAGSLESMIQPGRAAHSWRVAAQFLGDAGRDADRRRAAQQAVRISSVWGAGSWPEAPKRVYALTPRELDVARLAAQRVRSREIAARLSLSVRTVDNHLFRAFGKLGISSRDELAAVLDPES